MRAPLFQKSLCRGSPASACLGRFLDLRTPRAAANPHRQAGSSRSLAATMEPTHNPPAVPHEIRRPGARRRARPHALSAAPRVQTGKSRLPADHVPSASPPPALKAFKYLKFCDSVLMAQVQLQLLLVRWEYGGLYRGARCPLTPSVESGGRRRQQELKKNDGGIRHERLGPIAHHRSRSATV
jgi:hypothetical protein